MDKHSSSHHELKKINNIKPKASQKHSYYISNSSIFDYDYSLSSDNDQDKIRQPNEWKETDNFDYIVTSNVKNNSQCDDAI